MHDNKGLFTFCAMQPESMAVLCMLQEKKEKGQLSKREERQLYFLKERREEGMIWLLPALIFAAANQSNCKEFFERASKEQKDAWQEAGKAWMRHYPAFLDRIGWQERCLAILSAGFLMSVSENSKEAIGLLRRFLAENWSLLWDRIKHEEELGAAEWEELLQPWEDSAAMESAMTAVFLCMVNLQKKPVRDMDRFWRTLRRLKTFTEHCLEKGEKRPRRRKMAVHEENVSWQPKAGNALMQERLDWLFAHFKNPQRIAYLKERGRISSEWLDTLFTVMEKAGLERSACESMQIGGDEVIRLLECFTDRASERQYITFLLLYTVSRELVKAGRLAGEGETAK